MSRLSQRCARILRVRAIEHRVAAARMIAAERRVGELLGVDRRIGDLRLSLRPAIGETNGQVLQAMTEMESRLERAQGDLVQPIRQAAAQRDQATAARLIARGREDGMERLRHNAAVREESSEALRADAVRPFRQVRRRFA